MILKKADIEKHETILDALLRIGYMVDYQCRDGYCGICQATISGEIEYLQKPLAVMRPGRVLICCAIAKSDLKIEIDI